MVRRAGLPVPHCRSYHLVPVGLVSKVGLPRSCIPSPPTKIQTMPSVLVLDPHPGCSGQAFLQFSCSQCMPHTASVRLDPHAARGGRE